MAPKQPKRSSSKESGKPAVPAQYAKGMAELRNLLKDVEHNVSALTQTTSHLNAQISALENILAANAPLAEKLAKKMEQMSQSPSPERGAKTSTRKSAAPEKRRSPPKKPKAPTKPRPKSGK